MGDSCTTDLGLPFSGSCSSLIVIQEMKFTKSLYHHVLHTISNLILDDGKANTGTAVDPVTMTINTDLFCCLISEDLE